MPNAANLRKCRYKNCLFHGAPIDTKTDEYERCNREFYHKQCFEAKQKEDRQEEQIQADIQLIRHLWTENINKTVILSHLYKELNVLIRDRGIDSAYVIFTIQYCINNHLNLNYPAGIKFFIDKEEIKEAYKKIRLPKIDQRAFVVRQDTDDAPKFNASYKPKGFDSVLG